MLQETQAKILQHHGGDGDHARDMITSSYGRRHDEDFWRFWDAVVAKNHDKGDQIIDLGAGIGQFVLDCASRYPTSKVIGIEAAPYMLKHRLELPENAHLIEDDLHCPSANIVKEGASMVMANMLVHELVQPIKMFKAAYEWLKPGGRLCVIDVVRQPLGAYLAHRYKQVSPWADETSVEDLEDAFEHFLEHNRYHPDDLLYMLSLGGFKVVDVKAQKKGRFIRIVVEK